MNNTSICVARTGRRRSKWYVRFKRSKHLFIWGALIVAVCVVLGYGVVRAIKHNVNDAEAADQRKIKISHRFKLNQE